MFCTTSHEPPIHISDAMNDPNICRRKEQIRRAAESNNAAKLRTLVTLIDVNTEIENGWTALHYLVQQSDRQDKKKKKNCLHCLLNVPNIDVNKTCTYDGDSGVTPLHIAAKVGNFMALDALLKHRNIEVNAENGKEETALHVAAENGNFFICKALLKHRGTILNALNKDNKTVLHCISEINDIDLNQIEQMKQFVCLLLDNSRYTHDIDKPDKNKETALKKAAKARNQDLILILLRRGASLRLIYSPNNIVIGGIAPSTLKIFLDECITSSNNVSCNNSNYYLEFNYGFLSDRNHDDICEIGFLHNISDSRSMRHLLAHPIFHTFIYLKWKRIAYLYYINVILFTLVLIFVNWYVIDLSKYSDATCKNLNSVPEYIWILGLFCLFYLYIRELMKLIANPGIYFDSWEKVIEIAIIVLLPVLIAIDISLSTKSTVICQMQHILAGILPLLSWLEWFLLTGRLPFLSNQVEMLKKVSKSFLKLIMWYSVIVIGFSISFYIIFHENDEGNVDNPFQDIPSSLFKSALMMAGEINADNLPFKNVNVLSQLLFMIFVIFVTIVMINLLNGIAVSETGSIKKHAEISGLVLRVKSLYYIDTLLQFYCFMCNITNNILLFKRKAETKIFIYPNQCRRVSYTNLTENEKKTERVYERNYNKIICFIKSTNVDKDIIGKAKDILLDRKTYFKNPTDTNFRQLPEYERLNGMEKKLDKICDILTSLKEQNDNLNVKSN